MLRFSDWEKRYYPLDESIKDDIQTWLSRNFGGRVGKIDGIIVDLVRIEKDYAKKWEKSQMEISSMEGQMEDPGITDSVKSDFKKRIRDEKKSLDDLDRKRIQKIRSLSDEVRKMTEDSPRLIKYWNLKKSEAEVEVAENLYKMSHNLSDRRIEDAFYRRYQEAIDNLSKARKGIEDQVIKDKKEKREPEEDYPERKISGTEKDFLQGRYLGQIIYMDMSSFKSEMKGKSKEDLRKIKRLLIDAKNNTLNERRVIQRLKKKDLDEHPGSKEKILAKYNPKIYDLEEILDRTREKIAYLDLND